MEPQNGGLEDYSPFQLGNFSFHVNLPRCIHVHFQGVSLIVLGGDHAI